MSVTIPERRNSNDLPDDIFSYNEDIFYEFVKKWYGHDLAELFTFQAIRNGSHLVNSTVEDVLSVLQYESCNEFRMMEWIVSLRLQHFILL
jgi:hypothetical protein